MLGGIRPSEGLRTRLRGVSERVVGVASCGCGIFEETGERQEMSRYKSEGECVYAC